MASSSKFSTRTPSADLEISRPLEMRSLVKLMSWTIFEARPRAVSGSAIETNRQSNCQQRGTVMVRWVRKPGYILSANSGT
jgi:hypothetical protein